MDAQLPEEHLVQCVGQMLAQLRQAHQQGNLLGAMSLRAEQYVDGNGGGGDETSGGGCGNGRFVRGVPICSSRTHAHLPNGLLVCFEDEYRLAIHAKIRHPTTTNTAHNLLLRTYYMRYYPQGVNLVLLQTPFVHPGPEHPQDSDLIVRYTPTPTPTSSQPIFGGERATPQPLHHQPCAYAYGVTKTTAANARDNGTQPTETLLSTDAADPPPPSSSSTTTNCHASNVAANATPEPYILKKLQPIPSQEQWQPHRVLQRYWKTHQCEPPLPWWLQETFKHCVHHRELPVELYCGMQHYYVWYPLELQDASQFATHRVYCLIVNRVHWIEHLLEQQRRRTTLPRFIIQCLLRVQDQHHFLQLLMCETHWYSDQDLLRPVELFTKQNQQPTRGDGGDTSDLLGKWQALRQVREEMLRSGRWDPAQVPLNVEPTTVLDMYMPSYDFVFHEGELPDLTLLLILIGAFAAPNRADRPVHITNEILPLMNLMWKALLMPMKLRDHTRASSEKTQDSHLTFECQLRMVMAFYGGYYTHSRIITSFYTRHHLYRDLAYRQCSRKDFCNFLVGHYTHDATRQGVIPVKHKHLSLVFVKTYVFNMIRAVPSMHDMMSARYVGHQMVIERTLEAVDRCLQTREDMWFGHGAHWDRFERTYNAYVEQPERMGSKRRMKLSDDNGNELDVNDSHRSQNAKRRILEPRADCPFIFKRHKASARTGVNAAKHQLHQQQLHATQQRTQRQAVYNCMRGFICACVRFLLDQLAMTERYGPIFECAMYDQDHLDCDFDWFGRRGTQTIISVRQVLERVRSGSMTCDAAALCITVTQERVAYHYLQVTQQQHLPQFAASRMQTRCKQLITARLLHDMRVRFPCTNYEPAQRVSDLELLSIYCSDIERAPDGLFTDHRALTFPLHARSLVFHPHEQHDKWRCQCYHCHPSLPPAMKYSSHQLYRQMQAQLSSGALWSVTMSAPSMDLCEAIVCRVYHENLEYMYRTPNTSFVDNVVHSMNVAREDSRTNERFIKAAVRVTESERRLIAACVERMDPWQSVPYEEFGQLLCLQREPLQTLRNAEHMFNTHTYPVDVSTTVRDMPLRYPREFLLLEQLFTEVYCRRMVQVHRLPLEWTRQQVYSAHERHALVPRGRLLPLKMFEAYYCAHHGDIKRHIAHTEPWITASTGCTTAVGLDPRTHRMYCTTGFKRGMARAEGAQHQWRTSNDRMCSASRAMADGTAMIPRLLDVRNAAANQKESLTAHPLQQTTTADPTTLSSSTTITATVPPTASLPTPPPPPTPSLSSFSTFWNSLHPDEAEDTPLNCAADVFMNAMPSVSSKEHANKRKARRPPNAAAAATTFATTLADAADNNDDDDDDEDGAYQGYLEEMLTQPFDAMHNDGPADDDDDDDNSVPMQSQHSAATTRRSDKRYQLDKLVQRNRGRGPSAFSYQRHHQERLAQQRAHIMADPDNWDPNGELLPKVRQHRYRAAYHRSQDARCSAPLESVCMLGHALVLYGATFLACPLCNTIFRLQWSSFSDAHYMPLCGLCLESKQHERTKRLNDRILAPCHGCNPNAPPCHPSQVMRYLVLDDTVPGVHYWRYIHLCSEHNRDHIGDCEANSTLNNLELYIAHRLRYVHRTSSSSTCADGRPTFTMVRDNRTNHSHPFVRGGFTVPPDALTSMMNAVSDETNAARTSGSMECSD